MPKTLFSLYSLECLIQPADWIEFCLHCLQQSHVSTELSMCSFTGRFCSLTWPLCCRSYKRAVWELTNSCLIQVQL